MLLDFLLNQIIKMNINNYLEKLFKINLIIREKNKIIIYIMNLLLFNYN